MLGPRMTSISAVRRRPRPADGGSAALSEFARVLLAGGPLTGLEGATRRLLAAIDVPFAFLQLRGPGDPAEADGSALMMVGREPSVDLSSDLAYWSAVEWTALPSLAARVERGHPFTFAVADLPFSERRVFESAPTRVAAEIVVPITVEGVRAGAVEFLATSGTGRWDDQTVALAETAGSMIKAWWDREAATGGLRRAVEEGARLLRHERALTACSQALLSSAGSAGLPAAVVELLNATDATAVFVERNVMDPALGLCSEVVFSAPESNAAYDPGYWNHMPWSRMPISYAELSQGRPVVLSQNNLSGAEAATYARSPIGSEIDMPILVGGEWVGLIGFADSRRARTWRDELGLLTTAATMIGAHWERQQAAERLQELVRSKDRFLATVSHELRTPLTVVLGMAEILRARGDLDQETRGMLGMIGEQSGEMANLIDDLLVAARLDIGAVSAARRPLSPAAELEAVLSSLGPMGDRVTTRIEPVTATGDPMRVRQVIRNLISNAFRYGGRNVTVSAHPSAEGAVVEVRDDGAGVPAGEEELIFQPYFRSSIHPEQVGSVGVGLTISRHLARLMGGDLLYARHDGHTSFRLVLPSGERTPRPGESSTAV